MPEILRKPTSLRERRKLLQAFRKQFGLTLVELGKLAGLSQPMLSQFEGGGRKLSDEAWMRVVAAIQKLLAEDEARRKQEREKAVKTAGILGVPLTGFLSEMTFNPADLEKERARLDNAAELNNLVGHELKNLWADEKSQVLRKLKNPKVAEQLLEDYLALIEWRQKLLDLEAQGYVMTPKAVEEERDQLKARVAEMEKQLEAYQEQELRRARGETSG